MNRQQIESEYDVQDGMIRSLGKFEAEPVYAPYFYDDMLNGCSEILDWPDETRTDLFEVDTDDRAMFPELSTETVAVALEESEQGFVHIEELTQKQLDALRARNEREWEEAEETAED